MEVKKTRKIIHVDMDAFYASVEQRDNPKLKGKPIAVGYTSKRGVIAAASYEARSYGVHSAMPLITAMKLCPELLVLPPRFEAYRKVSNEIHAIFSEFTDIIEPLALDEAYLDVTVNKQNIATAWQTAKIIRAKIFEQTGLTASAGISYNKFLAKLASEKRKPNGQFAITPDMGESFIAALPVSKFYGVGPVTTRKMNEIGIHTGKDLRARSRDELKKHFGKLGLWYFDIARGQDDREVNPNRERKSLSSETTFEEDSNDQAIIESEILSMADSVWEWCEKNEKRGRTITVKIKWADFTQSTRSKSFKNIIETHDHIQKASLELIRSVFPLQKRIRLVGVTLSNFA
jgi:DNA polymerase IV